MSFLQSSELLWQGVGGSVFVLYNSKTWFWYHYVIWVLVIYGALGILTQLVIIGGTALNSKPLILERGKPLILTTLDYSYITFNKFSTSLFTYHAISFCWYSKRIIWDLTRIGLLNTLIAIILLYILYDLGYSWFHRILHLRSVYGYIHKHHHRQLAPFRGNTDAVNVHPFEFITGEYNHLFVIYMLSRFISIHILAIILFIILGGILASLNHTRFDFDFGRVYQVKSHDVHHWYIKCNYGQYTMFWDYIFGTFKSYTEENEKKKYR